LRARSSDYYLNEGKDGTLVIELPRGGYAPGFRTGTEVGAPRRLNAAISQAWLGTAIAIVLLASVAGWWWMRQRHGPISGSQRYETSAAYDLYRQARASYHPGREIADADVNIYQEAIDKDPGFAPGYAGLAAAYAFASSRPIGSGRDKLLGMRAAAQRSIQLDPFLAEGHDAMGVVYARLGEWDKSEQSFRRAIELNPKRSVTRLDFAMNLLVPLAWISNALQQLRISEISDPHSADVHDVYSYILISAGRFDEAEEHCRKSTTPSECLPRIRIGQGRIEEAIQSDSNPHRRAQFAVSRLCIRARRTPRGSREARGHFSRCAPAGFDLCRFGRQGSDI
jgi:tetratricopeptide (TPR) repeat protein